MANDTVLNTPTLWVNKYLQAKIAEGSIDIQTGIGVPFFPSTPSSIDDITEQWVVVNDVRYPYAGVMATYDRLIRLNKKSFPHIKTEQVMYYFYATQEDVTIQMVQTQEKILRFLDRGDESAQEVNDWCSNRQINLGTQGSQNLVDNIFYFHNFRVYQLEETRDIIDFGTARTYGGNKIIVEYEYHQTDKNANFANWKPEPKPATKIIV
jgi:hypothetical protein